MNDRQKVTLCVTLAACALLILVPPQQAYNGNATLGYGHRPLWERRPQQTSIDWGELLARLLGTCVAGAGLAVLVGRRPTSSSVAPPA